MLPLQLVLFSTVYIQLIRCCFHYFAMVRKTGVRLQENNCVFVYLHLTHTELKLVTPPTTTTTPTPYIYTTAKPPRRKQHQNHNHKGHDTSSRGKEKLQPNNLQENEIAEAAAGGSIEGMYFICTKTVAPYTHNHNKNNQ